MAHTFDANLRFTGSTNPLTSAYTCGANAKLLVLGIVTGGSVQRSGGTPTYNGVELTQADQTRQYGTNPETSCELWYLLEPGVSSALQISIPNPTSLTLHVQASSYNVPSGFASVLDVEGGNTGLSADPSVSVTPTVNGAVIVGVLGNGLDYAPLDQSGTELNTTDNGLYSDANQFTLQAIAAEIATGWTTVVPGEADWIGIDSSHLDVFCGEETGNTLADALDGIDRWNHGEEDVTHLFTIDLGLSYDVQKVRGRSDGPRNPIDVNIYVSDDKENWGVAVATGINTWDGTTDWVEIDTTDKVGRFVKVEIVDTGDASRRLSFGKNPPSAFAIFDVFGVPVTGVDDWCMSVAAFKQTNVTVIVEPDALALSLSLILPSIVIDESPTILPSALALTATLNAPDIVVDKTQEVTAQALTLSLKAPSVVVDVTVEPSALSLSLSLGNVSVLSEQNVTIVTSALVLSLTLEQPNTLAPLDIVRMMPFIFSSTIAYPTEFGNEYARFYFSGEPLLGAGEVHVEISTPYQSSDLYQLQTKQSADVMWIVHPSYPQAKLKRTTPTTFVLEDIVFNKGPFIERNDIAEDDGVTMNVNVTNKGGTGTLIRSSGTFQTGHIGALFKLTHPRVNRQTNGRKLDSQTGIIGEQIDVFGDYIFSITSRTWLGTVSLQRSTDDWVTNTNIKTFSNADIQTFKATETTENVQYRINVTAHSSGTISSSLVVNTSAISGSATSVGVIKVPLDVKGDFNFNTHGNWDATVVLERNVDSAGWEPYRTYVSVIVNGVGDRNVQFAGVEEEDNVQYRINVTAYSSGTLEADLQATSSTQFGIVRINGILSNLEAEITVVSKVSQTTDTKRWAEGAWSGVRGYPSAITLFEERAVYGFTNSDQQDIWLSETGRFEDFEAGIKDADSFALTIPTANRGKWLGSLETLVAGTSGGEWRIKSPLDESLTPKNWDIKKQTSYGGADVQVVEVGSVILFIDFVGRKIREVTFVDADQKYVAHDLTSLAEHITTSGIVCFAHQRNPDSILWCVLDNGDLITLSYEREHNVVAWARHPMDGLVQSVAVIPASGEDEVWISIVRAIDGENKIYIEQLQSRYLDIRKENSFFVDSGIIYNSILTDTITGLDHLEGKTVAILADGEVLDQQKVADGQVSLSTQARNVRVGLPFVSQVTPMRMDLNLPTGTTHGSIKKISEIVVSFHDTLNAKYGYSDDNLFDFDWTNVRWVNTSKIEGLFSGDITAAFDGGFNTDDTMIISQSDPLPATIRAIIPRVEKTGR